ncbi:MAG: amidohydrolase [Candidatus Tectomicrobia bacterium]|nr:amidohydrolase [Candidatus Tectomicrobia bacterium]
MKIDVHCHLSSPGFAEAIAKKTPYSFRVDREKGIMTTFLGVNLPLNTEEERITHMDRLGIDTQVISVGTVALLSGQESSCSLRNRMALSEAINDYLASICQQYPDRFMAFADIPLSLKDVDAATHEMIRSTDGLGLNGISLLTNYDDRHLDAPELQPFFEEANRRRLVILLHPKHPLGEMEALRDYSMYALVGFPYETTLTVARMVYSGLIERFSKITFILSHAGGTIPFLWSRIDWGYSVDLPGCRKYLQRLPSDYLRHFYYDTASADPKSLMLTYERVGDHLIFGTDHPHGRGPDIQRTVEAIEAMDVPATTKARIFGDNAVALLRKG